MALRQSRKLRGVNRYVKYKFTVQDFAKLYRTSEHYVRKLIRQGKFDPRDLASICQFWSYRVNKLEAKIPKETPSLPEVGGP